MALSSHGTHLHESDHAFLVDLEQNFPVPVPLVEEIAWDCFGFSQQDGRITQLSLCNQGLSVLPDSIGNLLALERLLLPLNHLETLPDNIGYLGRLKQLEANNNHLTGLPECVGNLTSLEILVIHGNQIESLPESVGNLQGLKRLSVHQNNLIEFPESITRLKNLQQLEFWFNTDLTLSTTIEEWLVELEANGCMIKR